jgi:quinol monooxygenase YgiN
MSNSLNVIKYVKHNKVRLKTGKREEATKVLLEFFKELEKPTGMRGFVIMDDMQDLQEYVVSQSSILIKS